MVMSVKQARLQAHLPNGGIVLINVQDNVIIVLERLGPSQFLKTSCRLYMKRMRQEMLVHVLEVIFVAVGIVQIILWLMESVNARELLYKRRIAPVIVNIPIRVIRLMNFPLISVPLTRIFLPALPVVMIILHGEGEIV